MDGSIQYKGDRVTLTVRTSMTPEAARDAASVEIGLPRDAVRFIAQQRLQDGTITYTFRILWAATPQTSDEAMRVPTNG